MSAVTMAEDGNTIGIAQGGAATELTSVVAAPHENENEIPSTTPDSGPVTWDVDPKNPYNWPQWKKNLQLLMISCVAFTG